MNQLNRSESITKSASALTRSSSPTYNGYVRFSKFAVPQLKDSSSSFVKPPHMNDPQYLEYHANKPAIDRKVIALNDLDDGLKLSILSDIERDQRINDFKESLKQNENKRKADHLSFDAFVKQTKDEKTVLQGKYDDLFGRYNTLEKDFIELKEKHIDTKIQIHAIRHENTRLTTLLAMKDKEIEDLNETMKIYIPQSPPNLDVLVDIMNESNPDMKISADNADFFDFTYSENPFIDSKDDDQSVSRFPSDQLAQHEFRHNQIKKEATRVYAKKATIIVTDPTILRALKYLTENVYNYSRKPFRGIDINGVRYAFYFGKVSTGGTIGLSTNIVLSSDKKVYNVSNIDAVVEMSWNQDRTSKGKRSFGHIYLGKLTGERGFEVYLKDPFMTELGVNI